MAEQVINDEARQRYTLAADGAEAFAAYEFRDGAVAFTHTVVPAAARGRGVGSALIEGALADIRQRGKRIFADCPFVADYVARHPADRDLLVRG